jgi:hypothetical protein
MAAILAALFNKFGKHSVPCKTRPARAASCIDPDYAFLASFNVIFSPA